MIVQRICYRYIKKLKLRCPSKTLLENKYLKKHSHAQPFNCPGALKGFWKNYNRKASCVMFKKVMVVGTLHSKRAVALRMSVKTIHGVNLAHFDFHITFYKRLHVGPQPLKRLYQSHFNISTISIMTLDNNTITPTTRSLQKPDHSNNLITPTLSLQQPYHSNNPITPTTSSLQQPYHSNSSISILTILPQNHLLNRFTSYFHTCHSPPTTNLTSPHRTSSRNS